VLKEALSWDPYNVTEDADLGLRFARMGKRTMTLESTTYEEANSNLKNWIRQRSRWIKGYMQTFLVHTRHPLVLYREIGLKNCLTFLATVGGLIFTVLLSPIFWVILLLWILAQPSWVPHLFPGPVYYMALISLFIGNFFFVFLCLVGAVGRGLDDLTPHALLIPFYWMLMSLAGYIALLELIVKPYYWQKTEHGLHLDEAADAALSSEAT
jgi:glycosyltransferase XagB